MDLVGLEEQSPIRVYLKRFSLNPNMIQVIGANPGSQWCRLIGAVIDGDIATEIHTMYSS